MLHSCKTGTRWWAAWLLAFAWLLTGCAAIGQREAFPGTGHGTPEGQLPPSPRYELLWLRTKTGIPIAAEFLTAQDAKGHPVSDPARCPTLIFFYARPMCLAEKSTQKLADYFRRMEVNVLIPDYPGYGMSGGRATEKGFYAAAEAAYDYAVHRQGGHPSVFIAGWSLGTGVAIELASRRHASGLIVVGAFTSIPAMARKLIPWPLRWLAGPFTACCRFNNLAKIPSVTCPILIVQGTEDDFVPPEMGDRLAAAAKTKVTRLPVPGAHHADIWDVGGKKLWEELADWIHHTASSQASRAGRYPNGGHDVSRSSKVACRDAWSSSPWAALPTRRVSCSLGNDSRPRVRFTTGYLRAPSERVPP